MTARVPVVHPIRGSVLLFALPPRPADSQADPTRDEQDGTGDERDQRAADGTVGPVPERLGDGDRERDDPGDEQQEGTVPKLACEPDQRDSEGQPVGSGCAAGFAEGLLCTDQRDRRTYGETRAARCEPIRRVEHIPGKPHQHETHA